jgi:hypothetical protein
MDILIEAHCCLIRTTRCLLAWGTTLHAAVCYLDTLPAATIATKFDELHTPQLSGTVEHHVGAPHRLADLASAIAARVRETDRATAAPALGMIYLLALKQLATATRADMLTAIERARHETLGRIVPDC